MSDAQGYASIKMLQSQPSVLQRLTLPATLNYNALLGSIQGQLNTGVLPSVSDAVAHEAMQTATFALPTIFENVAEVAASQTGAIASSVAAGVSQALSYVSTVSTAVAAAKPFVDTFISVMNIANSIIQDANIEENQKAIKACFNMTPKLVSSSETGRLLPRDLWLPAPKYSPGWVLQVVTENANPSNAAKARAVGQVAKVTAQFGQTLPGFTPDEINQLAKAPGLSYDTINILQSFRSAIQLASDGGQALFPIYIDLIRDQIDQGNLNYGLAKYLFTQATYQVPLYGGGAEAAPSRKLPCGYIDPRALQAAFGFNLSSTSGGVINNWRMVAMTVDSVIPPDQMALLNKQAQDVAKQKIRLILDPQVVSKLLQKPAVTPTPQQVRDWGPTKGRMFVAGLVVMGLGLYGLRKAGVA